MGTGLMETVQNGAIGLLVGVVVVGFVLLLLFRR